LKSSPAARLSEKLTSTLRREPDSPVRYRHSHRRRRPGHRTSNDYRTATIEPGYDVWARSVDIRFRANRKAVLQTRCGSQEVYPGL
jgi:hypothetical protein